MFFLDFFSFLGLGYDLDFHMEMKFNMMMHFVISFRILCYVCDGGGDCNPNINTQYIRTHKADVTVT